MNRFLPGTSDVAAGATNGPPGLCVGGYGADPGSAGDDSCCPDGYAAESGRSGYPVLVSGSVG